MTFFQKIEIICQFTHHCCFYCGHYPPQQQAIFRRNKSPPKGLGRVRVDHGATTVCTDILHFFLEHCNYDKTSYVYYHFYSYNIL